MVPRPFRLWLVLAISAFLLVFRLVQETLEAPLLLFSAWIFETCLFLWIYLIGELLARLKAAERVRLSLAVFLLLALFTFSMEFFYLAFFREVAARKFSLLDVDLDGAVFFFEEVVTWQGAALYLGALAALPLAALLLRRIRLPYRPKPLLAGLLILSLATGLHAALSDRGSYPAPLADFARDLGEALSHPGIDTAAPPAVRYPPDVVDRSQDPGGPIQTPFNKIIVFVMEGTTLKKLQDGMAELPSSNFFAKHWANAHVYLNFFSANQDSRTGMLAGLFGRWIPFEAYGDRDLERFRFLQGKRSLVDRMSESGFVTAAAASEIEQELVAFDLPWAHKFTLSEDEFAANTRYLCFNPYDFEHSCEDRILLPRLLEFLDRTDRVFLYQEAIFGHTMDFYESSHKSDVQYYAEYLAELAAHLESRGSLGETLIVLTSDHGIRDWEYQARLYAYRIPLVFINPGFSHRENDALFSQVDFKDILLAELTGTTEALKAHDLVVFIGSTSKSLLGAINRELDLLLVKNRRWRPYVLEHFNARSGDVPNGPPVRPMDPAALLRLLDETRAGFTPEAIP